MLNTDLIVESLQAEIKVRVDSAEGMNLDRNFTGQQYLGLVLRSLEAIGFEIVPKDVSVDGGYVTDFSQAILNWNTKSEELTLDDINGGQILLSLKSDGWLIIPPR